MPRNSDNPFTKLAARQREHFSSREAAEHAMNSELACLVQTDGWLYAQRVANEIQQEFNCKPTDPNWIVLTHIQYAFQQLFGRVKVRAATSKEKATPGNGSILAEIQSQYDNPDRRNSDGSDGTTDGGRRSSRAGNRTKRVRNAATAASDDSGAKPRAAKNKRS